MKKLLLCLAGFAITTTSIFAQKFSVTVHSGYTIFLGTKLTDQTSSDANHTLVDMGSGSVPIGVQLKYTFKERIFTNLDYTYGIGISKSDVAIGTFFQSSTSSATQQIIPIETKVNTQQILFGIGYVFTKESSFKPYVGLDAGVAMWAVALSTTGMEVSDFTKSTSFVVSPKIGFNFQFTEHFYLDFNMKYARYFSSKKTNSPVNLNSSDKMDASSLLGFGIGIGYTF